MGRVYSNNNNHNTLSNNINPVLLYSPPQVEDDVYLIQGNADLEDVCQTLGLEVRTHTCMHTCMHTYAPMHDPPHPPPTAIPTHPR